jgi:guanylate kinase
MSGSGRKGHAFVVAAPSGTGKTTICRAVVERDPEIVVSVSHTTRDPRPGEVDGVHYHFVDPKRFRELADAGVFLEHANYNGNNYGTSREALRETMLERGRDVLLEIEVQGARQIHEKDTGACFIFLLPPNLDELERRLRGLGTDSEDIIEKRLGIVKTELEAIGLFDYAVVNDDLETAIANVSEIIATERRGDPAELEALAARFGRERVWARWQAVNAGL